MTSSTGQVTTYVTKNAAASFASAIQGSGGSTASYPVVAVTRSWTDLSNLTQQIAADQSAIAADGLDLVQWGPDAASNTVKVQLANYSASAAQQLIDRYGSAVSVVPSATPDMTLTLADQQNDVAPWFGADPLFLNGNKSSLCTLGFAYTGNNSGNEFSATAGHCGAGTFNTSYNNNYLLGSTSTDYWAPTSSTNDVQSIKSPGGFGAYVWYNDTSTHDVLGAGNYGNGQLVTTDGFTTGEHPDWTIQASNQCISGAHFPQDYYTRCHLWEITNPTAQACYPGDSGGPVYQRTNGNGVYAAGLIIAGNSTDSYRECFYFGIYPYLSLANGSIMTG